MNWLDRIELSVRWSIVNFVLQYIANPSLARIVVLKSDAVKLLEVPYHDER